MIDIVRGRLPLKAVMSVEEFKEIVNKYGVNEVARRLNCSAAMISQCKSGKKRISQNIAEKIHGLSMDKITC